MEESITACPRMKWQWAETPQANVALYPATMLGKRVLWERQERPQKSSQTTTGISRDCFNSSYTTFFWRRKFVCKYWGVLILCSHVNSHEFTFMTAKTHTSLLPGQPHPNLFSFFPASQQLVANQHNFHFLKFLFLLRCSTKAKDEIIDIKTKEIFTRTCAGFSQKLHHAQFLPTTED